MPELAITGGNPCRRAAWPVWPVVGEPERVLVEKVISSGRWSYEGPMETKVTEEFAAHHGFRYGFCVNNGTVALELAPRTVGVGVGDEVIVPALTWIATASSVLAVGAVPVFVDVDPASYQLDAIKIESAVTSRTRAIIPVHLYCRLADVDAVREIAQRHGLAVIEDAAHAHGASWPDGRMAGSVGDVGTFSFQASKNLACGEGGFVGTNDEDLAEQIYGLKNIGRSWKTGRQRYVVGRNHRFTEMQAALLLAQLGRLEEQVGRRARNADLLDAMVAAIKGIQPLAARDKVGRPPTYAYVFRYDPAAFADVAVDVFRAALSAEGIPVGPTYGAVYTTALWGPNQREQWRVASGDVAERVNDEAVMIDQRLLLGSEDDMADISTAIRKIQANTTELTGLSVEPQMPASVSAPRH